MFALSGDGRRLVYARAPYNSNLWLADAGDGHVEDVETRELTSGTSLVERPSVSPDGASIAFNMGHEPVANLYTMPIAGGVPRQLTFRDSLNVEAAWSIDGKRIAFASTEGGRPRVWTVSAGGGEPLALSLTDMSDTFGFDLVARPRILFQQSGNRNYYDFIRIPERNGFSSTTVQSAGSRRFTPPMVAKSWRTGIDHGISHGTVGINAIDTKDRRERLVFKASAAGTSGDSVRPVGWSADSRSIYVLEGKVLNLRDLTSPGGETTTEARILRVPVNGNGAETVA